MRLLLSFVTVNFSSFFFFLCFFVSTVFQLILEMYCCRLNFYVKTVSLINDTDTCAVIRFIVQLLNKRLFAQTSVFKVEQ